MLGEEWLYRQKSCHEHVNRVRPTVRYDWKTIGRTENSIDSYLYPWLTLRVESNAVNEPRFSPASTLWTAIMSPISHLDSR